MCLCMREEEKRRVNERKREIGFMHVCLSKCIIVTVYILEITISLYIFECLI